jgi:hypothetical protein
VDVGGLIGLHRGHPAYLLAEPDEADDDDWDPADL